MRKKFICNLTSEEVAKHLDKQVEVTKEAKSEKPKGWKPLSRKCIISTAGDYVGTSVDFLKVDDLVGVSRSIGEFVVWPMGKAFHFRFVGEKAQENEGKLLWAIARKRFWSIVPVRADGIRVVRKDKAVVLKKLTEGKKDGYEPLVESNELKNSISVRYDRLLSRYRRGEYEGRVAVIVREALDELKEVLMRTSEVNWNYWYGDKGQEHVGNEHMFDKYDRYSFKKQSKRAGKGGAGGKMSPIKASCSKVVVAAMRAERAQERAMDREEAVRNINKKAEDLFGRIDFALAMKRGR